MLEPRRGAGDGEEGGRGGDTHAEWPSRESPAQVRQLSRKTGDVRLLGLEGDQFGERRCGGLGLLTAQGGAGRGDAVVDPALSRAEFDPFVRVFRRQAFGGKRSRKIGGTIGGKALGSEDGSARTAGPRDRQHTFP